MELAQAANPEAQLYDKQAELERLYSKNQLRRRIQKEFVESPVDFTSIMEEHGISVPFGYDLLVQMALQKRADPPTLVGLLKRHNANLQDTADMLLKCAEIDLVEYDVDSRMFIVLYEISEDVQQEIDRFQFALPMVVQPREVRTNRDTGYFTGMGSIILNNNHHEDDVCLDHINRMNAIPFTIDMETATMVRNSWRNLDKRKEGETAAEFNARKRAFEKYEDATKDVLELLTEEENLHYMTHRYDKRGRTYCMGYHVNYQGTSWSKAIIQLAEPEYVT